VEIAPEFVQKVVLMVVRLEEIMVAIYEVHVLAMINVTVLLVGSMVSSASSICVLGTSMIVRTYALQEVYVLQKILASVPIHATLEATVISRFASQTMVPPHVMEMEHASLLIIVDVTLAILEKNVIYHNAVSICIKLTIHRWTT
jgi:hypothetical protein